MSLILESEKFLAVWQTDLEIWGKITALIHMAE